MDDLESLRKALKIEKWVLFGHSYGGVLAQCFIVKYPERVAGALLVCSGLAMRLSLKPPRYPNYISEEERRAMNQ
jgi:proline iminopeptidase